MKRLVIMTILILGAVIMFVIGLLLGTDVYAQSSYWISGIGSIDALWNQSLVDAAFASQMAQHPLDGLDAKFQALYAGRQDVDNRISQAMIELCNHDDSFCADVFTRYGLRIQFRQ